MDDLVQYNSMRMPGRTSADSGKHDPLRVPKLCVPPALHCRGGAQFSVREIAELRTAVPRGRRRSAKKGVCLGSILPNKSHLRTPQRGHSTNWVLPRRWVGELAFRNYAARRGETQ
jgi:hypothetical protein